ncbi:MAG: hypothetical protein V7765_20940 [Oleispira sp.]
MGLLTVLVVTFLSWLNLKALTSFKPLYYSAVQAPEATQFHSYIEDIRNNQLDAVETYLE